MSSTSYVLGVLALFRGFRRDAARGLSVLVALNAQVITNNALTVNKGTLPVRLILAVLLSLTLGGCFEKSVGRVVIIDMGEARASDVHVLGGYCVAQDRWRDEFNEVLYEDGGAGFLKYDRWTLDQLGPIDEAGNLKWWKENCH